MISKHTLFISTLCALALANTPVGAQFTQAQVGQLRELVNRGNGLLQRRQYAQAIAEYQKCFEIDPNNGVAKQNIALVHNNWGILYFNQKKYAEARDEWEAALKVMPSQRDARNNLIVLGKTIERLGIDLPVSDGTAAEPPAAGPTAVKPSGAAKAPIKNEPGATEPPKTVVAPAAPNVIQDPRDPSPNSPAALANSRMLQAGAESGAGDDPVAAAIKAGAQEAGRVEASVKSGGTVQSGGMLQGGTSQGSGNSQPSSAIPPNNAPVAQKAPAGDEFDEALAPIKMVPPAVSTPSLSTVDSYDRPSSTPINVPSTSTIMSYPPQDAPPQVYEDKSAGTSITIMAKPTPPPPPPPPVEPPPVMIVSPPPTPTVQPEPAALAPAAGTFDDQLAALEMKVFGRKQKAMPILKRLEKLETGTSGSISQGTVQERVDALRKAYGL